MACHINFGSTLKWVLPRQMCCHFWSAPINLVQPTGPTKNSFKRCGCGSYANSHRIVIRIDRTQPLPEDLLDGLSRHWRPSREALQLLDRRLPAEGCTGNKLLIYSIHDVIQHRCHAKRNGTVSGWVHISATILVLFFGADVLAVWVCSI